MLSSGVEPGVFFISWLSRKCVRRRWCLRLGWMLSLGAVGQFAVKVNVCAHLYSLDSKLPRQDYLYLLPAFPFEAVQLSNR